MTLEAWVRPTAVTDWRTVLLKERGAGLAYGLYSSGPGTPSGYARINNGDRDVTAPSASAGQRLVPSGADLQRHDHAALRQRQPGRRD